jgi:GH15 family glucan-1,4-alpha-glucosidase
LPLRIEDYAMVGDTQSAALVGVDGSIDWLCLPRFDADACFAALLGEPRHGRWLLAPAGGVKGVRRRYRDDTLVLETEFDTGDGAVRIIDFMPIRQQNPDLVRIVEGVRGRVPMRMELVIRFGYGAVVPWVQRVDGALRAVGGPDALSLVTPVETRGEDYTTVADFTVAEGDRVPFLLTWHSSHVAPPAPAGAEKSLADTERWWRAWSARCTYQEEWREPVLRSLITLKALTYAPTGGIAAAATTSLPEAPLGVRNWDYRFCWLRDATLTLYSLMLAGYEDEARAWRDWLLRAVAGDPSQLQIMYGVAGERRLTEVELDWLPGYLGAKPVRIGNAAAEQLQLDVYGEVLDTLHQARRTGLEPSPVAWRLEQKLLEYLESGWRQQDEGIWEVRGPSRHFTHSKVMAWVAMDRAVHAVEDFGLDGPVARWKRLRAEVHAEVCREAYDPDRNTFTQYYGGRELDAALLLIPAVGFLPGTDERVRGTVEAVERELCNDGFVMRYAKESFESVDGLPAGEGAFLPCTFWLVDCYNLIGRSEDARKLFERMLSLRNDVGLLSEEYEPAQRRLLGNFPQAFSHIGLVNSARNLQPGFGPAEHRESTARPEAARTRHAPRGGQRGR